MKRGEIWWASLGTPRKSESGFRRPVIIVQSNAFNDSRISTVLAAVVTSNLRLAKAPGNILLKKKVLGKESVINISQIITIDKSFLTEKAGQLSAKEVHNLDEGLRLVLGI